MEAETKKVLVKKKLWKTIRATKPFENQTLGETYVAEPQQKIGATITINSSSLTGEQGRAAMQFRFRIATYVDDVLHAELVGGFLYPSAVRKFVRRGREKLDQSFMIKTKDGIPLRVKTVSITRGKPTGGVLTKLGKHIIHHLGKTAAQLDYLSWVSSMVSRQLQKGVMDYVKKCYPLMAFEIRSFERGQTPPDTRAESASSTADESKKSKVNDAQGAPVSSPIIL